MENSWILTSLGRREEGYLNWGGRIENWDLKVAYIWWKISELQ